MLIFDFLNHYNSTFEIKYTLNGTSLGENFGAAVASGDINNDGLDDLIVGAPLFTSPGGWDQGKFCVFSFSANLTSPKTKEFLGKVTGGKFGTAVAFLGDLNGDKLGG